MGTGRIGQETSLDEARRTAGISTLRALATLRQRIGSLSRVKRILRLTVYVQSAIDAASEILYSVFPPSGGHTRTTVGVYRLPKNASVELDMIVAIDKEASRTSG